MTPHLTAEDLVSWPVAGFMVLAAYWVLALAGFMAWQGRAGAAIFWGLCSLVMLIAVWTDDSKDED